MLEYTDTEQFEKLFITKFCKIQPTIQIFEELFLMIFTSVKKESLYELCDVFEAFLIEHDIMFKHMDLRDENGIISFIFCNDPEKARSIEFEAQHCLGLEMEYIAVEILEPVLPRLRLFK